MENIINEIRSEIKRNADENTRISGQRYFKEEVKMHGLKSAPVESIAREYFKKLPERNKKVIFSLCEEFWRSGYMEESFIACNWAYNLRKEYIPEDFRIFERWVRKYVTNWASCDTL